MTTRDRAPLGAPCWADLWTSDVEGARSFYSRLFGWEAQQPSPDFGGYFMFTRRGVPVAGGMGDMGDVAADDTWKIYLDTPDVERSLAAVPAAGGQVLLPPVPVADLGIQAVLQDAAGATVGAWQAGTFPGFTVLDEVGAPSWFELHARRYEQALDFYRQAFRWETQSVGDTDDFRYSTLQDPSGGEPLAGVLDAAGLLPEGLPAQWFVYWFVDDADEAVRTVEALGGSVEAAPEDTPYGRMASVADPTGARFKLRALGR